MNEIETIDFLRLKKPSEVGIKDTDYRYLARRKPTLKQVIERRDYYADASIKAYEKGDMVEAGIMSEICRKARHTEMFYKLHPHTAIDIAKNFIPSWGDRNE
ncbi:hypothetical protein KY332_00900 [Candidatus Woesearchaeota archaeon]|nr:hypothetical protein [Candidatus Woesearchaeota archaeon]